MSCCKITSVCLSFAAKCWRCFTNVLMTLRHYAFSRQHRTQFSEDVYAFVLWRYVAVQIWRVKSYLFLVLSQVPLSLSFWIVVSRTWELCTPTGSLVLDRSIRDSDLARDIHALLCESKQSDTTLIVGIVLLRLWPWRHDTNAIFPATSKLRLVVIAVALRVEPSCILLTRVHDDFTILVP